MADERQSETDRIRIAPAMHRFFMRYIDRMLRRHFHAVRLAEDSAELPANTNTPLIVYLNHASWWDPLLMLWLAWKLAPGRQQYGPIEAAQLKRYGFFKWLGVFGVKKGTAGARAFLRTAGELLQRPGAMLWLTPQGRFADVRERPVRFAPGLSHLAMRIPGALMMPLSLEFAFGVERLPEVFVRFGAATPAQTLGTDADGIQQALEEAMERNQDALAHLVSARSPAGFRVMLRGAGGSSGLYDWWRSLRAWARGERPHLNHGVEV